MTEAEWKDRFAREMGRRWPLSPQQADDVADGAWEDWDGEVSPEVAAALEADSWRVLADCG